LAYRKSRWHTESPRGFRRHEIAANRKHSLAYRKEIAGEENRKSYRKEIAGEENRKSCQSLVGILFKHSLAYRKSRWHAKVSLACQSLVGMPKSRWHAKVSLAYFLSTRWHTESLVGIPKVLEVFGGTKSPPTASTRWRTERKSPAKKIGNQVMAKAVGADRRRHAERLKTCRDTQNA